MVRCCDHIEDTPIDFASHYTQKGKKAKRICSWGFVEDPINKWKRMEAQVRRIDLLFVFHLFIELVCLQEHFQTLGNIPKRLATHGLVP
jgi:hypothetical protein